MSLKLGVGVWRRIKSRLVENLSAVPRLIEAMKRTQLLTIFTYVSNLLFITSRITTLIIAVASPFSKHMIGTLAISTVIPLGSYPAWFMTNGTEFDFAF